MADQGGAQSAAEAARVKALGRKLWLASRFGEAAEVARLLALGASIEHKGDWLNWTPLIIAAENGDIEMVTLLVNRGANLEARDGHGWTAHMRASQKGHLAVVKYLSDKGASINARDKDNYDALLYAALYGHLDVCLFLVSRSGDPRVVNRFNHRALNSFGIHASRLSHEEKQAGKDQILAAWRAGPHPDARWLRRRGLILALVGSKLRPMARDIAAAKQEQEQNDKHVSLPGIPRRTKQENWNYLLKEVFGHEGIVRCVADKM